MNNPNAGSRIRDRVRQNSGNPSSRQPVIIQGSQPRRDTPRAAELIDVDVEPPVVENPSEGLTELVDDEPEHEDDQFEHDEEEEEQ